MNVCVDTLDDHRLAYAEWDPDFGHVVRCGCGWFVCRERLADAAVAHERHQQREVARVLRAPKPTIKEAHSG